MVGLNIKRSPNIFYAFRINAKAKNAFFTFCGKCRMFIHQSHSQKCTNHGTFSITIFYDFLNDIYQFLTFSFA